MRAHLEISAQEARRIALAAQGFAQARPGGQVHARHLRRVIDRLGVLQLDSVNVLCRSHYLPLFSRLGPYPRGALDTLSAHVPGPRRAELIEYWAHEASLIPVELYPSLRWRMERAAQDAWAGMVRIAAEQPDLLEQVYERVRDCGPIRSAESGVARRAREPGQMWSWQDGKTVLEYLFWAGRITSAGRVNFERRYDLPERVLPADVLAVPVASVQEQQLALLRVAARALGVATESDLGDYFRLPREQSKLRVAELAAAGELEPVTVRGWQAQAFLWPAARRPRQINAASLLSPFDSLIWCRPRTERLFNFRYRLEIYTPAHKRTFGYYVLPFLLGDQLVARVDLKADRATGRLLVRGAFLEPELPTGLDSECVADSLLHELRLLVQWLGLDEVTVQDRGDLAAPLAWAKGMYRADKL